MAYKKSLLFVLLAVLLFASCVDPQSTTGIEISNNSSYNLHLGFENSDGVGMLLVLDINCLRKMVPGTNSIPGFRTTLWC
ncbi:hypothetical protein AGMMS50267_13790 [Spirochaetia bacterium]|nr:hypothetical protein AGMMS50267_13790 [Spirochaetia bacterium]